MKADMLRSASATAQRTVWNDGRRRVAELGPKFTFLKVIIPDVDIHFVSVFLFFSDSHSSDGQSEILKKKEKHQACWIRLFGPIKRFQSRTRLFFSSTPHKRLSYGDENYRRNFHRLATICLCLQISTAAYKMWNKAATVLIYLICTLRIQEKNRNSFICFSVFIEVVYIKIWISYYFQCIISFIISSIIF